VRADDEAQPVGVIEVFADVLQDQPTHSAQPDIQVAWLCKACIAIQHCYASLRSAQQIRQQGRVDGI
jgi:hypothetical protein